jgi:hypothetical protein
METPAPKTSRIKRFFRRVLFVLAALITLGALLLAEENWRGGRAWRNYKNAMEAKGERFDAARLIPPKVPDEENFAMTPFLAPVFNLPPGDPSLPLKGATNRFGNGFRVRKLENYAAANRGANIAPPWFGLSVNRRPHPVGWIYGMAADLTGWAEAIQGTNSAPPAGKNADPVQAASIVLDNMKTCEPTLMELQSATARRYCRFNIPYEEWDKPEVSQVRMEHFVLIKWLFRFLTLHAQAEMVAGQTDRALEDINVMFRLDDGLKEEPLLISQLVRYASATILLQPVAEGLAEGRWSDAQLRALQERLGQMDVLASTVQAFYGERDICANPSFDGPAMKPRGWFRLEQLNINKAFQELLLPRINLAAREVNPAVGHACDLAMSNFTQGIFIHHRIMAAMLLPSLFGAARHAAETQTDVDLVTVACALERYRLAEGNYPDQLAALTPRFIAALPHDIINGQPLKYRRASNGKFILYSVGWNGKDDGGATATDKEGRPDTLHGDWVLEYPD